MTPDEFDRQIRAVLWEPLATHPRALLILIAVLVLIGLIPWLR